MLKERSKKLTVTGLQIIVYEIDYETSELVSKFVAASKA